MKCRGNEISQIYNIEKIYDENPEYSQDITKNVD